MTHLGCESQSSIAGFRHECPETPSRRIHPSQGWVTLEGCLRGLSGEVVWSCVLARVRMEAENQASDKREEDREGGKAMHSKF